MPTSIDNKLAGYAIGYRALHAKRVGRPTSQAAYPARDDASWLVPLEHHDAVAPDYPRAKVELDLPALGLHAWQWREAVAFGDELVICSDHVKCDQRELIFDGFVEDVDWQFTGTESVIVTAAGRAFRLRRDAEHLVYGRYMKTAAGDTEHFSALPTHFNAGGLPNRVAGELLFTFDGDPDADWWRPVDVFHYLLWRYNGDQTWLANPTFDAAEDARTDRHEVRVEGLSLWEALAATGEACGFDVAERVANDGTGDPAASIAIVRKHEGSEIVVAHQAPEADGAYPQLDLEETSVFAASIAESTASCVAAPVVAGGARLYEVTVKLSKAWDSSLLTVASSDLVISGAKAPGNADKTFVKRHCTHGDSFANYRNVGRLWDANTDGRYSAAPYSLSELDPAAACGLTAQSWPKMPYAALPCHSHVGGERQKPFAEITYDGGATWCGLAGAKVLSDRLAVWFSAPNPAAEQVPDKKLTTEHNYFARLIDDAANVKVRLTCTVAAPYRSVILTERRPQAGTPFETGAFFDRGAAGRMQVRSAGSRFADLAAYEVAEAVAAAELERIAEQLQDHHEGRAIEASLPVEWPAPEVRLTDQVTRIAGLEYDLSSGSGPARRYPRVVAIHRNLTAQTYNCQLTLDTHRKAGVI